MHAGNLLYWVCLVTLLSCCLCTFISISGDQLVEEGSDVTLTCAVQNPDIPVIWIKFPNNTLNGAPSEQLWDQRITVSRSPNNNFFYLHLKNISWTDAGTYQCQQRFTHIGRISSESKLSVKCKSGLDSYQSESPIIFNMDFSEVIISQGNDVQLYCNASGFLEPQVYWWKLNTVTGNTDLVFPGKHLNICDVQRRDSGKYYCDADNGLGRNERRELILLVEYAPAITVPHPEVKQAVNYTSQLSCLVDALPAAETIWLKEGEELSNDTRFYITKIMDINNIVSSTLTLLNIEETDFGNYTCRAFNKLGFSGANIHLFESPFPISPITPLTDYPSKETRRRATFNVTGFILGMCPPLCISFYIILHLGFRSRYAEERPEEEGGDGLDEVVWEQGLKVPQR